MIDGMRYLPDWWKQESDSPGIPLAELLFCFIEEMGRPTTERPVFYDILFPGPDFEHNASEALISVLQSLGAEEEARIIDSDMADIAWDRMEQFRENLFQPIRLRTSAGLRGAIMFLWGKAIKDVDFTQLGNASLRVTTEFIDLNVYMKWMQTSEDRVLCGAYMTYLRDNLSLATRTIEFLWVYATNEDGLLLGTDFLGAARMR